MIAFILKVTLCWLFFYGVYELFLKKRTFFNANRSYLLVTMLAGIALPLLEFIPWKNESNVAHVIYPMLLEIDDLQAVVTTQTEEAFNWFNLLYIAYGIGLLLSLSRFILGISKIVRLYRRSERIKQNGYVLVLTNQVHLPFSFFKWVFFSNKMGLSSEVDRILEHEIEHIKGRHSFDVLGTELLKVFFWCSPMIYLYRNALKEVHEFLADNVVVKNSDKITYKRLLLNQTNNGLQMALTHQFFNSHLKNRLKMISQKRSGRPTLVMYALGIPVLLLLLFAFTYSYQENNTNVFYDAEMEYTSEEDIEALVEFATLFTDTIPKSRNTSEVFKVVEEMPRFPGCEDMGGSRNEIEQCSKEKMFQHIYSNLKYPKEDKENGVEGMAVAQFVINQSGEIQDIKIVKSLSPLSDAEVIRVMNTMNTLPQKWRPGIQRGKAVNVQYTLPVRFKLQENTEGDRAAVDAQQDKEVASKSSAGEIFKVVEEMPRFPGCEDGDGSALEKEACSKQRLLEHVYQNLKYPKVARDNGIEGVSVVKFVVRKDGTLSDFEIVKSLSAETDESVLKVARSMNNLDSKWIPGRQKGEKVDVAYMLPVKFKLQGGSKEEAKDLAEGSKVPSEKEEITEEKSNLNVFKLRSGESEDAVAKITLSSSLESLRKQPLIYLDGEKFEKDMSEIDPNTIASVSVLKGEKAKEKYGQEGENGVIEILTKDREVEVHEEVEMLIKEKPESISIRTQSDKSPLYVIDGKVQPEGVDKELKPEMIEKINVLKGEAASKKYGEKGSNGVVEITTKGTKVLQGKVEFDTPAYWPTCADLEAEKRQACSHKMLISYVSQNLKYSKEAAEAGIEGMVVTGFTVGKDGKVKDIKIKKNVKGLDKSAVNLLNKMAGEIVWEAATKNGKKVAMEMVLPIRFKLPSDKKVETSFNDCINLESAEERAKCKEAKAAIAKKALENLEAIDRDLELSQMSVYPNPARETVNISFKADAKATTIQLIDIDGKLIKDMSDKNFDGSFEQTIDLSDLNTKLLLLRVEQEGKIFTRKIIVE